ncbi:MAG: DUF4124 domain-containing protein [Rhodoferax sp.]
MKHIALIAVMAAGLLSMGASAQWLWLDKDGRKVYSDRAPPATVLEKDILKRPGQARANTAGDADIVPPAAALVSAPRPASAPQPTALDKELAERKKKAEQLEADKRKAEEAKIAQARAENCTRAKSAKMGLDSGIRLSRINAQGEREVLDDAARAAEASRVQSIIESDCK